MDMAEISEGLAQKLGLDMSGFEDGLRKAIEDAQAIEREFEAEFAEAEHP